GSEVFPLRQALCHANRRGKLSHAESRRLYPAARAGEALPRNRVARGPRQPCGRGGMGIGGALDHLRLVLVGPSAPLASTGTLSQIVRWISCNRRPSAADESRAADRLPRSMDP